MLPLCAPPRMLRASASNHVQLMITLEACLDIHLYDEHQGSMLQKLRLLNGVHRRHAPHSVPGVGSCLHASQLPIQRSTMPLTAPPLHLQACVSCQGGAWRRDSLHPDLASRAQGSARWCCTSAATSAAESTAAAWSAPRRGTPASGARRVTNQADLRRRPANGQSSFA